MPGARSRVVVNRLRETVVGRRPAASVSDALARHAGIDDFVTVPDDECGAIESTASRVSYGWGMIPVSATVGETAFTTSLFPKDGGYVVPLKDKVRNAEDLDVGDVVTVRLTIDVDRPRRGR